jgi:PAS domain S-box-containing protein
MQPAQTKLSANRPKEPNPKWMRLLLDLPFIGVAICDTKDQRWLHFNDRFCAMVGYESKDLVRMKWRDVCHPGDRAESDAALKRVLNRRSLHVRSAVRLIRKDGSLTHVEIDLTHKRSRSGSEEYVVALVSNAAIHPAPEVEAHAVSIFSEGRTAMVVLDAESWTVVDANPAAQAFYGWTLDEMKRIGLHAWDVSLTDRALTLRRLREAAAGAIGRVEGVHRTARGDLRDVEIYCGPVQIGGRRCVYGIVHDRTESKRAEAARRDAEEKLHAVVEQSITGNYIIEDGRFSFVNRRMAEIFGYANDELIGVPALEVIAPEDRDQAAENIRRRLAGEVNSVQFEIRGLRKDGTLIDVGAHGSVATIHGKRVIVGVLQDITERVKGKRRVKEYVHKLETAMLATVDSISRMVDLRDPYTAGHERRVADVSAAIARGLGFEDERIRGLEIAGRLHDIGKIAVPSEILVKPARLSSAEFMLVKQHAAHGHEILNVVDFPWPVAEVAHQHHERMDGSGYPRGLKGDEILHEARIMAVADVIEAMASHRPYRASLGIEPALAEIEKGAGRIYDPDVSRAALRLFRDQGYAIPV